MRVVLDTNVLIDAAEDDFNAQARLINAVRQGKLKAVATTQILREYRKILTRLKTSDAEYQDRIADFLDHVQLVSATTVDIVLDDEEDRKFLAAAVGGEVDALITKDRHLLDVGEIETIPIMTPAEGWTAFEDQQGTSSAWQDFIRGIGIGRR
jgi:putative PIN family toxin of toxin-antitoxin system